MLRGPGIEPGSTAWKAAMLTVTPATNSNSKQTEPNARQKRSHAGTRTRVLRVRAAYPNQLDYAGIERKTAKKA